MMTRPLPIAYRSLGVLVGSFFLSASAGCINPKDDYADFARRPLTEHDAGFADVELRGKLQTPTQSCGELDGQVDLIMLSLQGDGDICIFTRIIADAPFPVFTDSDYACDPGGLQPRGPRF